MSWRKWLIGEPETTQLPAPKMQEVVVKEATIEAVIVAKSIPVPPSPPPPVVREALVRPFQIRSIDHQVILDGISYNVQVRDFNWSGGCTHARVIISRPGFWEVYSNGREMLTWKGRTNDCVDSMIAAFANAGFMVNRRLIDSCLFPVQNQILEIERQLKSFK